MGCRVLGWRERRFLRNTALCKDLDEEVGGTESAKAETLEVKNFEMFRPLLKLVQTHNVSRIPVLPDPVFLA